MFRIVVIPFGCLRASLLARVREYGVSVFAIILLLFSFGVNPKWREKKITAHVALHTSDWSKPFIARGVRLSRNERTSAEKKNQGRITWYEKLYEFFSPGLLFIR